MKQQRIENILLSLKKQSYMTRKQLQTLHRLGGDRNANRVLKDMSEYLHSFKHGMENVYYLSKQGRERVNSKVIRKKTAQVEHFLLRNQLWIHLKCPVTWKNEVKIKAGDITIVCDAMFYKDKIPVFIEVDVSQPMTTNRSKIEKYRRLSEVSGQPFRLYWVTELDSRKPKLSDLMTGLQGRVYTLNEIL